MKAQDTAGGDYEHQSITTWRLSELLQIEKDSRALRAVNAELLAALRRLVTASEEALGAHEHTGEARALIARIEGAEVPA